MFAAWVSNIELTSDFIEQFNNALAFGVANIDEAVLQNQKNIKGFDAVDYLKKKISYNLSEEKKLGLKKFLELM